MCKAEVTIQDYNSSDIIEMSADVDHHEDSADHDHLDFETRDEEEGHHEIENTQVEILPQNTSLNATSQEEDPLEEPWTSKDTRI